MTKIKVFQIGFLIAFIGFLIYKISPLLGLNEITSTSISNLILLSVVLIWVLSYLFRVISGKMTFIEQRRRYRKKYDEIITSKLENRFDSLSVEDKEKLLKELEEK